MPYYEEKDETDFLNEVLNANSAGECHWSFAPFGADSNSPLCVGGNCWSVDVSW
jgi:hypothetical protein